MKELDAPLTRSFVDGYAGEFDILLDEDRRAARCASAFDSACTLENATRNRYSNVLANEHTRVRLKTEPLGGGSDYINANAIAPALIDCLYHADLDADDGRQEAPPDPLASFVTPRKASDRSFGSGASDLSCASGRHPKDCPEPEWLSIPNPDLGPSYIATQGPVRETIAHFWQMIFERRVSAIVMLTREFDSRSSVPKCDLYWPMQGTESVLGDLIVRADAEYGLETPIIVRKLSVRRADTASTAEPVHNVVQFQYVDWPDQDVPDDPHTVLRLCDMTAAVADLLPGHPVVVHCSAGVGRTGTYIAIDIVLRRIRASLKKANGASSESDSDTPTQGLPSVDAIRETVRALKVARSKMVQTPEQYRFVFQAVQSGVQDLMKEDSAGSGKQSEETEKGAEETR